MKKIILKTLLIILLVSILLSNFSYATTLTNSTLKKSLIKIFGSNVKIETVTESPSSSGNSKTTYTAPTELTVTDNQILFKEVEENQSVTYVMDYLIENNTVEFVMDSTLAEFNLETESEEEFTWSLLALFMMQNQSIQMAYLATADALNIDLEVANSYYSQLINVTPEETENEETGESTSVYKNELFTYTTYLKSSDVSEDISMLSSIVINLDEFSKVSEDSLDGTITSTITLSDTPVIDENTDQNSTKNTLNETTTNNVVNNSVTSDNIIENTNRNIVHINTDNTVANTIIPAAGTSSISLFIIILISISFFFYIRIEQYKHM